MPAVVCEVAVSSLSLTLPIQMLMLFWAVVQVVEETYQLKLVIGAVVTPASVSSVARKRFSAKE